MPTRREFLETSVAALALDPSHRSLSPAEQTPPPSLQALTSMKSRARPITLAERQQRIERAR